MMRRTVDLLIRKIGLVSKVCPQRQILSTHAAHETLAVKHYIVHRSQLLRVIDRRMATLAVLGPHRNVLVIEQ